MKALGVLLTATLIFAVSALGQGAKTVAVATAPQAQASQAAPTLASAIDREIGAVEKQVLEAAEAMPEDKFNFPPEGLNLPGGNYKGVRTFAVQVKHIAASNYFIWSGLTGDAFDESQQVVFRNLIFQPEVVGQRFRAVALSHHDQQASDDQN